MRWRIEINYAVSQSVSPDGFRQAGYGEGGHIMYAYYVVLVIIIYVHTEVKRGRARYFFVARIYLDCRWVESTGFCTLLGSYVTHTS